MEKVVFDTGQRGAFKGALRELKREVDECVARGRLTQRGQVSSKGTSSKEIKELLGFLDSFNCVSSIGIGNSGGFLNNDSWIAFVRKDILQNNFVNSDEFSVQRGVYIFIAYGGYLTGEHYFKIKFGFPKGDINNARCKGVNTMEAEGALTRYDFAYTDLEPNLEAMIDNFLEMLNYFNSIPRDDFRIHTNDTLEQKESAMKNIPLNQILYGPPGTGKTYSTIDRALEILQSFGEIKQIPNDRESQKEIFNEYRDKGQIEFVTFHQNYGYEEFVEGIKPVLDSEDSQNFESSDVRYTIESGIFKEICERAHKNYKNSQKVEAVIKQEIDLNEFLESYADFIQIQLNEGETPHYGQKGWNTKMKIRQVNRFKNGSFRSICIGVDNGQTTQNLNKDVIMRDYEDFKNGKIKDWNDIKPTYESQSHRHGNALYYFALYDAIKNFEEKHYKKEATESSKIDNALKPYILIIDEINRGNISKILGELITLLEPSKRKGEKEWLELTLPYSKESFSVPNNLYIIGTMNTADRSIALLDSALRRRFEFIEMMPDSSLLSDNCEGINLQRLLEALNNRIEFLLSREQTIGHAFLIDVKTLKDLKAVFQNKIIPLLQEYFYNDYARIAAVLNNNGMIESKSMRDLGVSLSDEMLDSEKVVYRITESSAWKLEYFKKIYE